MRPLFPFYGSKWNMARYYAPPEFDTVVEPFAGSAGYSLFYNAEQVILADADPIISELWRYLIGVTPERIMALPDLPNVGDTVDDFDLAPAEKSLIGFWLNRGSATPKKSRTAYSARTDRAQLNWGPRAKDRIAGQIDGIRGWRVLDDYEETSQYQPATWFIDPPYVEKGRYYRVPFTDYERLARWSRSRWGRVIVCEGVNADWLPFEALGSFKTSMGRAPEMVYMPAIDAGPYTPRGGPR